MAIVLLAGQPVFHHHHGTHIVAALQMAHVVAFNAKRGFGKVEMLG